jgi:hypothetical protein
MSSWKSEAAAIRSRCGFCNVCLDTWAERVEHLAEHFKQGKTMAAWHGDWGFEPDVLDMVENSMPPCRSHLLPLLSAVLKFARPDRLREVLSLSL